MVEAFYGGHEFVEPEHCFIGVCKIGSLDEAVDWQQWGLPAKQHESIQSRDRAAVSKLFDELPPGPGDAVPCCAAATWKGQHLATPSLWSTDPPKSPPRF